MQAQTHRGNEDEATGCHPSPYSDGDRLREALLCGLRISLLAGQEREETKEQEAVTEATNELHE